MPPFTPRCRGELYDHGRAHVDGGYLGTLPGHRQGDLAQTAAEIDDLVAWRTPPAVTGARAPRRAEASC